MRLLRLAALALVATAAAPAAAWAGEPLPAGSQGAWTISFEDRATGPDRVSASIARWNGPLVAGKYETVTVRLLRAGNVVGTVGSEDQPDRQTVGFDVASGLAAGDTLQVVGSETAKVYFESLFTGRPFISDRLCSTYSEFKGTQTSGIRTFWVGARTGAAGSVYSAFRDGKTNVAVLRAGATSDQFIAKFPKPLEAGQFVTARSMQRVGPTWVFTDVDRPVETSSVLTPLAPATAARSASECIATHVDRPLPLATITVGRLPKGITRAKLARTGLKVTLWSESAVVAGAWFGLGWEERVTVRRNGKRQTKVKTRSLALAGVSKVQLLPGKSQTFRLRPSPKKAAAFLRQLRDPAARKPKLYVTSDFGSGVSVAKTGTNLKLPKR